MSSSAPDALPATADPAPFTAAPLRNSRVVNRALVPSIALAVLANAWFRGEHIGWLMPVFTALVIITLLVIGGREAWTASGHRRPLLLALLLFSTFLGLRDSLWLSTINWLTCIWLALTVVLTWSNNPQIDRWNLLDLIAKPFIAFFCTFVAGVKVIGTHVNHWLEQRKLGEFIGPVVRSFFLAAPVIGILLLLLGSADAAFRARLEVLLQLFNHFDPINAIIATTFISLGTVMFGGGLVMALTRSQVETPHAPAREVSAPLVLGRAEGLSLLTSMSLLLGAYDSIALQCALPGATCELPAGITYADYARSGFFQLLIVATIVLIILLVLPPRIAHSTPGHERITSIASTALIIVTLPVLISAIARMDLYERVYNFTTTRVMAQVIMLGTGTLLVWRGVTLWKKSWSFTYGAILTALSLGTAVNVLNLDRYVVERSLANTTAETMLDTSYLLGLSHDVPETLREQLRAKGASATLQQDWGD